MKRSNPKRNTPTHAPTGGVDYETGEMHGDRSRTDFAGSSSRKARRGAVDPELGVGGDRRRSTREMQAGWASRGGKPPQPPQPPPVLVLYRASYGILMNRVQAALALIVKFGGIDGEHHKAWVIDQVTRLLAGDGYDKLVSDACETDHEWKTGTAP